MKRIKNGILIAFGVAAAIGLITACMAVVAVLVPEAKNVTDKVIVAGIAVYGVTVIMYLLTWLAVGMKGIYNTKSSKAAFKAGLFAPLKFLEYLITPDI